MKPLLEYLVPTHLCKILPNQDIDLRKETTMPGNVVAIDNFKKHLTKKELENRKNAEYGLTRNIIKLAKPLSVKNNKAANDYWNSTIKRMKDISMLDDLDSDMLARYCHIAARIDYLNEVFNHEDAFKDILPRIEAAERNMLSYADKLGLTPNGRIRLAKKRAEGKKVDENSDLYGDEL